MTMTKTLFAVATVAACALLWAASSPGAQVPSHTPTIDVDDSGGVVTGAQGAEAGVWVIAETRDLPTKFARIVVTDVGAMGEQVRREGIGSVAAAAEPSALAHAVLKVLEPAAYEIARQRCVTLARTLSWSAAAQLTLDAYGRICSGGDQR